MAEFITILYPLVALATVIGYLPQIRKLIVATRRPQNVSLASWLIWTVSGFLAFAYAGIVLQDFMLSINAGLNAALITLTTGLIIYNNYIRFEDKDELKEKITKSLSPVTNEAETTAIRIREAA